MDHLPASSEETIEPEFDFDWEGIPQDLRIILEEILRKIEIAKNHGFGSREVFISVGKKLIERDLVRLKIANLAHHNQKVEEFIKRMEGKLGVEIRIERVRFRDLAKWLLLKLVS